MCTYIVENNFCIGAGNFFSILYKQLSREYIKTLDKKNDRIINFKDQLVCTLAILVKPHLFDT